MTSGSDKSLVARLARKLTRRLARSPIEGFVDHVLAGEVFGWAIDTSRPDRRVHVVAISNGQVIAEALADLPRNDLITAGKGDGRYGFRLRVNGAADHQDLRIEAVARPRNVPLTKGRISLSGEATPSRPALVKRPKSRHGGFLESCENGQVTGWAFDMEREGRPVEVDIFEGERFLGNVRCDRSRADLSGPDAPTGAIGFRFTLPPIVGADVADRLRARVSGARGDLRRASGYPGSVAATAVGATGAAAMPRPERTGLAFVVVGPQDADALEATRLSCKPFIADSDDFVPATDDIGPAIARAVERRTAIVVLTAGQTVTEDLVSGVAEARSADVWVVSDETMSAGPAQTSDALAVDLLLGRRPRALVVAASVLSPDAIDAYAALRSGDVDALCDWGLKAGLTWGQIAPGVILGGQEVWRTSGEPAPPPRRITLAVWSGWTTQAVPSVLKPLLDDCGGMDVEVLVPAATPLMDRIEVLAETAGLASLSMKLIGTPSLPARSALWRTMTEAATGQVVALCAGDAEAAAYGGVRHLAAWTMSSRIGAAAPRRVAPCSGPTDRDGPWRVDAVSAQFVVLSRSALATVGGIDVTREDDDGDLDLGRRLGMAGRATIIVPEVTVSAPGAAPQKSEDRFSSIGR